MEVRALIAVQGHQQLHFQALHQITFSHQILKDQLRGLSPPLTAECSINTGGTTDYPTPIAAQRENEGTNNAVIMREETISPSDRSEMHMPPVQQNQTFEQDPNLPSNATTPNDFSVPSASLFSKKNKKSCYIIQKGGGVISQNEVSVVYNRSPKVDNANYRQIQDFSSANTAVVSSFNAKRGARSSFQSLEGRRSNMNGIPQEFNNQEFEELYIGGESIRERPNEFTSGHATLMNPQLQIVKTICSTKNSFLPNFKTKKREYIFGEHKLNNRTQSSTFNQNRRSPFSQEGPRIKTIDQGIQSNKMSSSPPGSPKIPSGMNTADIKYLQKLEKLVKHKHKLSHLIQDTITRTVKSQLRAYHQSPQSNDSEQQRNVFNNDVPPGRIESFSPTQSHRNRSSPGSHYTPTYGTPNGTNRHQQQRAVIMMNQAIGSSKKSYINDDIFKQANDEEATNYMKFILNEMKPNYHKSKNAAMFQNRTDIQKSHIPGEASLSQLRTHSLIELEGGAIGLVPTRQNPEHASIPGSRIMLQQDQEEEESAYQAHLKNNYSFNQLSTKNQQQRAQSQSISKRQNIHQQQEMDGLQQPRSRPDKPGVQSCMPTPIKGDLKNNDTLNLNKIGAFHDTPNKLHSAGGEGQVVSERQSVDSSQYKTIKFKLMIMKSPQTAMVQPDGQNMNGEPRYNRIVGGRESAKNFRKELKRYTLVDVFGGSPQLPRGADQSFLHVGPYKKGQKRPDTVQQRKIMKRLNSKFGGIKGASISLLAQHDGQITQYAGMDFLGHHKHQLTIDHNSQETIMNSSAAPLSNKMSAKYKSRHAYLVQQSKVGGFPKTLNSEFVRATSSQSPTVVPFLSQEFLQNDNTRYLDEEGGAQSFDLIDNPNQSVHRGKRQNIDVKKLTDAIAETPLDPLPPKEREQVEKTTQKTPLAQQTFFIDYNIKSGGEVGAGLFSTSQQMMSDTDQEGPSGEKPKGKFSLDLKFKGVYNAEAAQKQSKRRKNQKELNTDLHQMIANGGPKSRPTRDPNHKTIRSGGQNGPHSSDRIKSDAENNTAKDAEQIKNDTLSFETSQHSSETEKKDISMQVDKVMETSLETSQMMLMDEQFMRNANYFMKYFDNLKYNGNNSSKDNHTGHHNLGGHLYHNSPQFGNSGNPSPQGGIFGIGGTSIQWKQSNLTSLPQTPEEQHQDLHTYSHQPNATQQNPYRSHTTGKQRIQQVQYMNQTQKVKAGELGSEVLQGRPIKPIKQLIKENFHQFALYNLQLLQKKQERRLQNNSPQVPQKLIIDIHGGSPKRSLVKKLGHTTPIIEEDGDMRLSKYIWSTIQQLKAEGQYVDMELFKNDQEHQFLMQNGEYNHENQAFNNKRIKNANFYQEFQKDLKTQQQIQRQQVSLTNNRVQGKGKEPNADLQFNYNLGNTLKIQPRDKTNAVGISQDTLLHPSKVGITDGSLDRTEDEIVLATTMNRHNGIIQETFESHIDNTNRQMTSDREADFKLIGRGDDGMMQEHSIIKPIDQQQYSIDLQKSAQMAHQTTLIGITKQPVISFRKSSKNTPQNNISSSDTAQTQLIQRLPLHNYSLEHSEGSEIGTSAYRPKNPKFEINLAKINNPQNMYGGIKEVKKRSNYENERLSTTQPIQQRQQIISLQTQQHDMQKRNGTAQGFQERRTSNPPQNPNIKSFLMPLHDSNYIGELASKNRPTTELRTKTAVYEVPNQRKLESTIYNHQSVLGPSLEQQLQTDFFGSSVFYSKPSLLKEIVPVSSIMHLRNKNQRMLATSGVVTPVKMSKQKGNAVNEFQGNNVIIKDLNTLRNKDLLRMNEQQFNSTQCSAEPNPWAPVMIMPQTPTKNINVVVADRTSKSRSAMGTHHNRFAMSQQGRQFIGTHQGSRLGKTTTLTSPVGQAFGNILTYNNMSVISPKNSTQRNGNYETTQIEEQQPKKQGYFLKVKKGRVLEDQTAGVKQSNGIKVFS